MLEKNIEVLSCDKIQLTGFGGSCCFPYFFVSRATTQLDEGSPAHCVSSDGVGWMLVCSGAEQSIKGAHFQNDERSGEPTES